VKLIKEGDKVLIAGFYGDEMNFVNNKLGYVKNIILIDHLVSLSLAATIQITPMVALPLNYLYLYNTKDLLEFDELLMSSQFLPKFLQLKKIKEVIFNVDSEGNHIALCKSDNNIAHYLAISTLN
jgi:hypothetical protein